jgi:16S rRNA U516 pseudouridylate synthase RsuA-like enzyme
MLSFAGASNYYRRLCRRYKDREARLDAAYRRLIRQAAFLGVEMRDGDTISSFAARVDEKAGDRVMTRVWPPVILHRFALQDIRNDDVRSLCDRYAAVEKRLKRDLASSVRLAALPFGAVRQAGAFLFRRPPLKRLAVISRAA